MSIALKPSAHGDSRIWRRHCGVPGPRHRQSHRPREVQCTGLCRHGSLAATCRLGTRASERASRKGGRNREFEGRALAHRKAGCDDVLHLRHHALSDPRIATLSPKISELIASSSTVILEIADLTSDAAANALAGASRLPCSPTTPRSTRSSRRKSSPRYAQRSIRWAYRQAYRTCSALVDQMLLASSECERGNISRGLVPLDARLAETAKEKKIPVVVSKPSKSSSMRSHPFPTTSSLPCCAPSSPSPIARTISWKRRCSSISAQDERDMVRAARPCREAGIPASAYDGMKQKLIIDRNFEDGRPAHSTPLEKGGAFVGLGALHLPDLRSREPHSIEGLHRNAHRVAPMDASPGSVFSQSR